MRSGRILGISFAIAQALVLTTGCASVPADLRDSRLALQRSAFSLKYSYEGSRPERVMGLVTYRRSFLDVLSEQPDALAEAKKAVPYDYAALGWMALATVYAASETMKALDAAQGETLAELDRSSGHSERAVGAVLSGLLGFIVINIPATSHKLRSVRMFNAASGSDPVPGAAAAVSFSPFPSMLRLDPSGELRVGWTIRTGGAR